MILDKKMPFPEPFPIQDSPPWICSVCLNLNFALLPQKDPPCVLDEYIIKTLFSDLKESAESGRCLACCIMCAGLESWRADWENSEDADIASEYLTDETLLVMDLRRGHSLRVTLANVGFEHVVELYTLCEEDNGSIPAFGISRPVATIPSLKTTIELASEWLKKCNKGHASCSPPTGARLPSRVIDVGHDEKSDTVHLKETKPSDQDPYMSLSHCWGKEQIITTTTNTLQDRKAGIKLSELSKTFRHAVKITRGLGIQYIWIDSLCIIQDDKKDWEIESAKMADVYMNSQLNLAATHSSNGKGGCFAERWSFDTPNQIRLNVGEDVVIEPDEGEEGNYKIFLRNALHVAHDHFTRTMDYANTMEEASPLLSRAWVFQERLLSARTLHFHAEELVWECASGISCECSRLEDYQWGDPDGLLQQREAEQLKMMYTSISAPAATESQILDTWLELVKEYCALNLTKQMDRLTALSGLASRVATRLSGEYLAGIWSQDLPRSLCWVRESTNRHPSFRDIQAGAPSWSWASVWTHVDHVPGINYDFIRLRGFVADSQCQIQGFDSIRSPTNPFGICGDTTLKIRGCVIQASFQANEVATDSTAMDWAKERNLSKYMKKTVISNVVEFGQESAAISGDCFDANQRLIDIKDRDSVYLLLLGQSKISNKEFMSKFPSQYLTEAEKVESEEKSSQLAAAFALVLIKVIGGSTYRRAGLLVHRGGVGWWDGALPLDVTLV